MNPILKSYFPIADIISGTFGSLCEVAVHDLTQPESSVVYVANGTVTGREEGQSFDHLVKQVLLNKNFKDDRVINYIFTTPDGRRIKSSSALIRDNEKNIIGMICINYDISLCEAVQGQINTFLDIGNTDEFQQVDVHSQDVNAILDDLIRKIIGTSDAKNFTRKKCVELIRFMDEKGIFLVKGSIDKVAALMGVSRVTIYSYLDEARGKRQKDS